MLKRIALLAACALIIEGAGTPVVTYAAVGDSSYEQSLQGDEGDIFAMSGDDKYLFEKEIVKNDEGDAPGDTVSDAYDDQETQETPVYEPEEPVFVSPVNIDHDASIKLGEQSSRLLIANGAEGSVDISGAEDSDFEDILPFLTDRWIYSSDSNIISVSEFDGRYYYKAVGCGSVSLTVSYNINQDESEYTETYECYVTPDMTEVAPDRTKLVYRYDASSYIGSEGSTVAQFVFSGLPIGAEPLSEENSFFSYRQKSGSKVKVTYADLYENVLSVGVKGSGKTQLDVTVNGKVYNFTVSLKGVKLNKSTFLVVKGRKARIKAKNLSGDIVWTSDNDKVVSVKDGVVKAKKEGSALITAQSGEFKLYTVVNVVSKKKMSAIKKGKKIVKGTYSQAKRMRNGYYDCSSLVWRILKSSKVTNFGIKWYAPVAAGEAKYLVIRGKKVGAINNKNIRKRKFNPGDLYFATGRNNHRYKGIYHVEMFTGYDISGLDSKGRPKYTCTWLNRVTGYPYFSGVLQKGFLARP